jgi:hypothetical protein
MTDITPQSVFQRSLNAAHQSVAGEAIIIDIHTGQYYSLNESGAWLWEHLDGQRSVADLAQELAAFCAIPDQADMVQADLLELLAHLAQERLVQAC